MRLPTLRLVLLACVWTCVFPSVRANDHAQAPSALARATVLIIRHAEEPGHGNGLSAAGQAHAAAYVNYFANYSVAPNHPLQLSALFAAANSGSSHRSSLTLLPLSQAIGLPLNTSYKDDDYAKLADVLQSADHGRYLLVCWHHGHIPDLIRALGGDPRELLPSGKWPDGQYGWVVQLRYDKTGALKSSQLIVEDL